MKLYLSITILAVFGWCWTVPRIIEMIGVKDAYGAITGLVLIGLMSGIYGLAKLERLSDENR